MWGISPAQLNPSSVGTFLRFYLFQLRNRTGQIINAGATLSGRGAQGLLFGLWAPRELCGAGAIPDYFMIDFYQKLCYNQKKKAAKVDHQMNGDRMTETEMTDGWRACEWCSEPMLSLYMGRQRFCCRACSDAWYQAERRQAVAWFRESGLPVQVMP